MPFVLTTASGLLCGNALPNRHGGAVSLADTPTTKLRVNGSEVLVLARLTQRITGCANAAPPQNATPCATAAVVGNPEASKLTVAGAKVLLDSLTGTAGGGIPLSTGLVVNAGHSKLTAV